MKKHHKPLPPPYQAPSSSFFEWNLVFFWLKEHLKECLVGSILFLTLVLLLYFSLFGRLQNREADYLKAAGAFQTFSVSKDSESRQAALSTLQELLYQRPELHAAYDSLIAQILINEGRTQEARPFALSALARTRKNDLSRYTDFAQTTLLIGEKNFDEALSKTSTLTQTLTELTENPRPSFEETLYTFNLFRLAILDQQTGSAQMELKTWETWKAFRKNFPAAYERMIRQFESQRISLAKYAEKREKILRE